jgi:hypothetical protein
VSLHNLDPRNFLKQKVFQKQTVEDGFDVLVKFRSGAGKIAAKHIPDVVWRAGHHRLNLRLANDLPFGF